MVEAIRVFVRYEIPNEDRETRRERNTRLGEKTPEFIIPENGKYIWEWFVSLNDSISRVKEGVCYLIAPSEVKAWIELSGNIVYSWEYDILSSMDRTYCEETNKELRSIKSRREEEEKRRLEQLRSKRGRRS